MLVQPMKPKDYVFLLLASPSFSLLEDIYNQSKMFFEYGARIHLFLYGDAVLLIEQGIKHPLLLDLFITKDISIEYCTTSAFERNIQVKNDANHLFIESSLAKLMVALSHCNQWVCFS